MKFLKRLFNKIFRKQPKTLLGVVLPKKDGDKK